MAAPEPHQPTEDELLATRLSDFFATVNGPPRGASPPPPPPVEASPAPKPEMPKLDSPPGTPAPSVDMVRLMKYLDAQLELTRQEAREGTQKVLDAVTELAERHADFREELFDWLEGYTGWERGELVALMTRISEVRDVLIPAAIPDPPSDRRATRFGGA